MCLQTKKSIIKRFKVDNQDKSFEEDNAFKLVLEEEDGIGAVEFDLNFKSIFILKNDEVLEKRKGLNATTVETPDL